MQRGSHAHAQDERNESVRIFVNGRIVPRAQATVSVFDSGFLLGDGVWEGIRLHNGQLVFLDEHLDRLYEGAKAIDLDIGMDRQALTEALYDTCSANGMHGGVHIRLVVSRGEKRTPYQSPAANVGPATVVIIPEWKEPDPAVLEQGLSLFTVHVHRGAPDVQDPMWNSLSKLNCISACIQAQKAGADEALMLDPHGFVATCNSTHFFVVRRGELWTSSGLYCLHGITRAHVIELARAAGHVVREKSFSLTEVYGADEAFVTGTFAGLIPVTTVDGRRIGGGARGPVTEALQRAYAADVEARYPARRTA
ncbi:MAG: aminotransferase class IV [Halofilum sp. (in: g-proteobacteria)]|nr:aminotransferase class IV [Halofilum sp. (in: g-proteobacteria)]